MMKKDNIVLICNHCTEKRRKEFQKSLKSGQVKLEVGSYIKIKFKDGEKSEHMWVEIKEIRKDEIIGRLDNEPVVLENIFLDDEVKAKIEDIEDIDDDD